MEGSNAKTISVMDQTPVSIRKVMSRRFDNGGFVFVAGPSKKKN